MFRNSSISNSRINAYGAAFLVMAAVWLVGSVITGALSERLRFTDELSTVNYWFELEKLRTTGAAETLFLGDSSLGALMDTPTWEALRNKPSVHLALSGNYGFAGSYNMLRRALRTLRPKNVVLVHSVDLMTRPVAYLGYLETLPEDAPADEISLWERLHAPLSFYLSDHSLYHAVLGIVHSTLGIHPDYFAKEWVRLPAEIGAPGDISPDGEPGFRPDQINPDKTKFLQATARLCREAGVNCIFAFGPVYEEICAKSHAYLEAVRATVRQLGMTVVDETPICVPRTELADTVDHVRQDHKPRYTRLFHRRIARYLVDG